MDQQEIAEKLIEVDARSKSNKHRLDKVEERQDNLEQLTNAFTKIQTEQEYIKEDVTEIKADVKKLADVPAERWKNAVNTAITAIVGALIGYLISGGRIT